MALAGLTLGATVLLLSSARGLSRPPLAVTAVSVAVAAISVVGMLLVRRTRVEVITAAVCGAVLALAGIFVAWAGVR